MKMDSEAAAHCGNHVTTGSILGGIHPYTVPPNDNGRRAAVRWTSTPRGSTPGPWPQSTSNQA